VLPIPAGFAPIGVVRAFLLGRAHGWGGTHRWSRTHQWESYPSMGVLLVIGGVLMEGVVTTREDCG
jgi:hypothetical protein